MPDGSGMELIMKKKLLALLFAFLMLLSVSSCKKSGGDETDDSTADTGAEETSNLSTSDYTVTIREDIQVVHESEDGRRSTKTLRYPELSGMADAELEKRINDAFRSAAEAEYKKNLPDVDIYIIEDTLFNYEVASVEVTYLSNKFISVRNSVYLMTSVLDIPDEPVYCINMTLDDGKILDEDDIFGDFNAAASKFIDGRFSQVYGIDNLMAETSFEDMILQYKSDYASYPEVWFTPELFCMNIDLVPALGTSAGFSIPLSEAEEFLQFMPEK